MASFAVLFSLSVDKTPQQSRSRWEDGDLQGIDCMVLDVLTGGGGDGLVSVAEGADKVKAFVSGC